MVNLMYKTAKGFEYLSIRLGVGKFEVGDNWKCQECFHDNNQALCSECQETWVEEIKNVEYSDTFEKRLSATAGIAGLVMGVAAWLANASMGLWEQGELFAQIAEVVTARLPSLDLLAPFLRIIYNSTLLILVFLSLLAVLSSMSVICYMMTMNPWSKRHWRHMTPGVYLMLVVQGVEYWFLLSWGVTRVRVTDILMVVGPINVGWGGLVAVMCMRKSEVGNGMSSGKSDKEERGA